MNIDMLVFGEDWGHHPSSTQHLIRHLIKEQEIVWVNSLGLRRPRLNMRDLKRVYTKAKSLLINKPVTEATLAAHPKIVNPVSLPFPGSNLARWINGHLLSLKLKPLITPKESRGDGPLLWTSLPSAVDVVGKLGERAAVYYCGDDFSALDGVDHEPVAQMEQELAQKCQLIITASAKLANKFPANKTVVLPHGVDYELFATEQPRAADLPQGPVAGFYGALAGWFDQQLMVEIAAQLPDWTFVLIGPVLTDISLLLKQPNIRILGPREHSQLPAYSQHWDIGLLPFKRNAQIEACNPLKLREYLAAGSPVVSTDFPALDGYRDLIKVGNDALFFANSIKQLYVCNKHKQLMREIRQQRVHRESWAIKSEELKQILSQL